MWRRRNAGAPAAGRAIAAAPRPLLLAALLLAGAAALLPACEAKITFAHLMRDDRSFIPIAPDFAFSENGFIDITIRGISIWQHHNEERDVSYDNFGMILVPVVQPDGSFQADLMAGNCPLGRDNISTTVLTFDRQPVQQVISGKNDNASFHIELDNAGWQFLYFVNCENGAAVSFQAKVSMYNQLPNGKRDYLSVGETELTTVYFIMFGLFLALCAAWATTCAVCRANAHRIHALMALLLAFKTLTLLAQALMTKHVEAHGTADGWNVAYYIFTTARGLLFFTVVVLIGAGWSYMKPFIDDNTRKTLMVVVPLQVFANIALVFIDEESPAMRDWFTWRDIMHFVDIACCCAILFPIVWQIKHLRESAEVDGKAARSLAKLKLFRSFYVTVVAYIYFTRIIVYLLRNTVAYRYIWLTDAAAELAALAFYTWVGVSFRPVPHNAYLKLEDEDIEMSSAGAGGAAR